LGREQYVNSSPAKMDTYTSLSKQMPLTIFKINTYKNQGGGVVSFSTNPHALHFPDPSTSVT
jgi:hypothetical protein